MTLSLEKITFEQILPIWQAKLWPDRVSEITATSAMTFMGTYDLLNMVANPTFFAVVIGGEIAGVNSGHMCKDLQYRSRGLYVFEQYRRSGVGKLLLEATIQQAWDEHADICWSYPRMSSWNTYQSAGFSLMSAWETSETSEANAYCAISLSV